MGSFSKCHPYRVMLFRLWRKPNHFLRNQLTPQYAQQWRLGVALGPRGARGSVEGFCAVYPCFRWLYQVSERCEYSAWVCSCRFDLKYSAGWCRWLTKDFLGSELLVEYVMQIFESTHLLLTCYLVLSPEALLLFPELEDLGRSVAHGVQGLCCLLFLFRPKYFCCHFSCLYDHLQFYCRINWP